MKLTFQQIIARSNLYLFWIFILAVITSQPTSALNIRGEKVLEADILILPPVCKLIVVDKPGSHHGAGNMPLDKHIALFERPGYEMAAHNPHLHHYCWALISKQRYFRAQGKIQREFYFKQFMGDIDYVINNTADKTWPYFHVMLIEQAEMLKLRRDYPYSLLKIDEALRHKPTNEKAYALKTKVYIEMGDKQKAIDTAHEGLEKIPQSKYLRWQLEKLGIKAPPPELNTGDSKENISNSTPTDSSPQEDVQSLDSQPAPESNINADVPPSTENNIPYCRFCP